MNPTLSADNAARGRIMPWVIAAFFVAFIIPLLLFTWIAFQHKPVLVTEHAYDKGLAYNDILAREAAMEALGWKAQLSLQDQKLVMQLADKAGSALRGATGKVWLMRPASAEMDQSVMLHEVSPGRYEVSLPHLASGLWQVRVTAEYQGQQFQAEHDFSVR